MASFPLRFQCASTHVNSKDTSTAMRFKFEGTITEAGSVSGILTVKCLQCRVEGPAQRSLYDPPSLNDLRDRVSSAGSKVAGDAIQRQVLRTNTSAQTPPCVYPKG